MITLEQNLYKICIFILNEKISPNLARFCRGKLYRLSFYVDIKKSKNSN